MKLWKKLLLGAAAVLIMPAGDAYAQLDNRDKKSKGNSDVYKARKKDRKRDRMNGEGRLYDYSKLRVPADQLPPPGDCRVWFPDRPAGQQQAAPQSCDGTPPVGAWLIKNEGRRYRVDIYNNKTAGLIDRTRFYRTQWE